ncbi:MAG: phosphatase PAP2 family protein [Acidobacteriota bacterium]
MTGLPPMRGFVFTALINSIIERGAVSGGCFPSSHVAGAWGAVMGLSTTHRRAVRVFGFLATGMSFACVYTRYHHAIDVLAGLLIGLGAGWWVRRGFRRCAFQRPSL